VNGAEHTVKLDGKCNDVHTDLIRHHGIPPVATSAELYHVYRTWESPHRCFEATCELKLAAFIRKRGLTCRTSAPNFLKLSSKGYRDDRNLVLCLPQLTVFVSIEADRPGAWIPGPLGPYPTLFPGIGLSREFERVKVPGNPMKSPFCVGVFFGGSNSCDHYLRK
jgi:hypothetical protein